MKNFITFIENSPPSDVSNKVDQKEICIAFNRAELFLLIGQCERAIMPMAFNDPIVEKLMCSLITLEEDLGIGPISGSMRPWRQ